MKGSLWAARRSCRSAPCPPARWPRRFTIDDNGKRQELTWFSNDVQPITAVMLLDRSGSMMPNFDLEERDAEAFASRVMGSQILLKFSCDRRRYLHWIFQAKNRGIVARFFWLILQISFRSDIL